MEKCNLAFRYTQEQKAVFASSRKEIFALNQNALQSLSLVMSILGACIFVASLLLPPFYDVRILYAMGFAVALALLCFSHKKQCSEGSVLCALYALFGVLFGLAIYLSVSIAPEQRATVLLGFVPLMPLLIMDKPWRVNLFVLAAVAVHMLFSLWFKPWDVPLDDFVNCLVFALLGIYVGSGVRVTRLMNFALQHEAEKMAKQDFLTGLYNRRKMYDVISASEAGTRVICGTVLFDIDHFKGFNDQYGHQEGDACLVRIGAFLREFARAQNMEIFRFGGEEFAAFQYSGDAQQLSALAEKIRAGIYACNIPYPNREPNRVCVSVGYCAAQEGGNVYKMMTAADHALYCAKNAGRNCCCEGTSELVAGARGACSML